MLLSKQTNIAPEEKKEFWKKLYNNFNVGLLAMITGVGMPFIVPILGQLFAPIFFIGGAVAVLRSKKPVWIRIAVVLIFVLPLVFWWDQYVYGIYNFMQYINQPAS